MMHIRSRRILAAVSAAALLFTSVPSGAFAGEPEYDEALPVMQEEEVPEESAELQEADIPGSPEESAAGEADTLVPDGEELSSDDQEVVEIDDLLVNEEAEDPETMVVEDGIPEEDEEQIVPDEEEILEAADGEEAPSVRIEIFNAEPDEQGVYRGQYSYVGNVIITGTKSDDIWIGWGGLEDDVPVGSELQRLSESWRDYQVDAEGVQTASLWTMPDKRENVWEDSLFLRLSEDEEWQKYSFVYDKSDDDVLISMKDEYQVYEPLHITARYDNPDDPDWNSAFMQVCIYEKADYDAENWEEYRYRNDQGIYFRDDEFAISQSGEYVLTATVFRNTDNDDPEEIGSAFHIFTVTAENGDLNVDYDPGIPAYFRPQDNCQLTIPFPEEKVEWMNVRIAGVGSFH